MQINVRISFNESRLSRIRLGLEPRTNVGYLQEPDAQPDVACRTNDFFCQEISIIVGLSVGRVMQVMKLADGGDSRERHLEKCHA